MGISVGVDPEKAFSKIDQIDAALKRLMAKSKSGRNINATKQIRAKVATVVEKTIELVSVDIIDRQPRWSGWLGANWEHIQGESPPEGNVPTPKRFKGAFVDSITNPIEDVDLDGELSQYLYNDVEYAYAIALDPELTELLRSASPDWFLSIGQALVSGQYTKAALSSVKSQGPQ
jgi:hypothetical protein